jgi:hypothetical protein
MNEGYRLQIESTPCSPAMRVQLPPRYLKTSSRWIAKGKAANLFLIR